MRKEPLVSVIITTYKRPFFLERAVNSILDQTYNNIEVLVIDDNNKNTEYRKETEKVMKKYKNDKRVNYIKHQINKNGAAARNTGIKYAKGKYVTYLDDDDIYKENKVYNQVNYLEENKEYYACYCGWDKNDKRETPKNEGNLAFEILSGELLIRTNTIMMRRDISLEINGWDESYKRHQEVGYLIRYFEAGYLMGSVPKVLVYFDSSDRSNASNPEQNEKDIIYLLEKNRYEIEKTAKISQRNSSIIYSLRYRSVFLNYIKYHDYKNALRIYLKQMKTIPIRFNTDLLKYTYYKLLKIDVI